MKLSVDAVGACRKKITAQWTSEEVDQRLDELVGLFAKEVKVSGFRPGRVPRDVVRRRFARELREELSSRLVSESFRQAKQEQGLDPVAILEAAEPQVEPGRPVEVSILLDVPPVFDLPTYKGLELEGRPVAIDEDEIDRFIEEDRKSAATYESVEDRPVRAGDLVKVDYEAACEGRPLSEVAPDAKGLDKAEDFWVRTDEHAFLPGFDTGLIGASVGEERTIGVDFKDDFADRQLAGKRADYRVTVKGIRERKLPPLDETYAKRYGLDTMEDVRAKVRELLERNAKVMESNRLKSELLGRLLTTAQLDVPESEVQEETRVEMYGMVRQQAQSGLDNDAIMERKDALFAAATKGATDRVKLRYILHRIAQAERIEPSAEEAFAELRDQAMRARMSRKDFQKLMADPERLETAKKNARLHKTVDWLFEQAVVKTPEGTPS